MQLLTSIGPNSHGAHVPAREGHQLPQVQIDLMGAENRRPPYTERNRRVSCRRSSSTTAA
jgi:hypothetical protein